MNIFLGDTHGEWETVFRQIKRLNLSFCNIVHVGDIGVGFYNKKDSKHRRQFDYLNRFFSARKIKFYGVRGNHDSPKFFDGSVNLSHFKLIPDYTHKVIGGVSMLFVGGAISIDRKRRKEGYSYWEGEAIKPPPYPITEKPDIIVAHDAPLWAGKDASSLYDEPGNPVKSDAIAGRKILGDLAFHLKPRLFVHGHYHFSYSFSHYGTIYRGLDIDEFWSPTL